MEQQQSNMEEQQGQEDFASQLDQQVSPEKKRQMETAQSAITQMIYDPKTKGKVVQMLKSGEESSIEQTLPKTVLAVFRQFEGMTKQKNGDMPLDMKLALGVHTFMEVKDMGTALGLIPEMDLNEAQPMLKDAMQEYIRMGLKDKSIDPLELQEQAGALLTDAEKEEGMGLAGQHGIPGELSQQQSTQGLLSKKMQPLQVQQQQLMKENQQMRGALQGIAGAEG